MVGEKPQEVRYGFRAPPIQMAPPKRSIAIAEFDPIQNAEADQGIEQQTHAFGFGTACPRNLGCRHGLATDGGEDRESIGGQKNLGFAARICKL